MNEFPEKYIYPSCLFQEASNSFILKKELGLETLACTISRLGSLWVQTVLVTAYGAEGLRQVGLHRFLFDIIEYCFLWFNDKPKSDQTKCSPKTRYLAKGSVPSQEVVKCCCLCV